MAKQYNEDTNESLLKSMGLKGAHESHLSQRSNSDEEEEVFDFHVASMTSHH